MQWLLLMVAVVLIGLGVDMLRLARHRRPLPQSEVEKKVYGHPVHLSPSAYAFMKAHLFRQPGGASTWVLAVVLIAGGVMALGTAFWMR